MMKILKSLILILIIFNKQLLTQVIIEGDFRARWYSDSFSKTLDQRAHENYMNYLSRIRVNATVEKGTSFHSEIISLSDRRIETNLGGTSLAGTGTMRLGITRLYADMNRTDLPFLDLVRFRIGRQQFSIGNGLSLGESYYFLDKFDGARADLLYRSITLSLFGAITKQNLSISGLYPEPGSDQIYAARLGTEIFNQQIMGYFLLQKLRGLFNDSYILGCGSTSTFLSNDLEYFTELAYQKFNTAPGFPKKHGIGYMGGISYRFSLGPFRVIKIETRYAAYQGDDASTKSFEQFSPLYPSFFWGEHSGYVNGDIGGNYPNRNRNLEGCRIWYTRFYVTPRFLPNSRIQFQYIKMNEYINNDGYNTFDDEYSIRIYYIISKRSQLQFRFSQYLPNGPDKDFNNDGKISSSEDRISRTRFMLEWQINF